MSVIVSYPVTVERYQVEVAKESATIVLDGIEGPASSASPNEKNLRRVGSITFSGLEPTSEADFITRGGFLHMQRPLTMLSGILALLQHERPLFLDANGNFSTTREPIGETDAQ